jgi:hypothetical protein
VPGRYDFPYRPRQRDGWFRIGEFDVTTTAALVGIGVLSMLVYAVDKVFLYKGALYGPLVRDGDVWRVATWPLVNPPDRDRFFLIVIGLVFTWFIGHEIEDLIGRKRFTILTIASTILPAVLVCALATTARTTVAYGLYGLDMGFLGLIALHQPNRPFLFGIPAWVMAIVYAFIDFVQLAGDRLWGTLLLDALVVVTAATTMRQFGYLGDTMGWMPVLGGRSGHSRPTRGHDGRTRRPKAAGKVVEGPWSSPQPPMTFAESTAAQAELDGLLDKISASGLESLTNDEKRRLNELSKRLR